MYIYAYICIYRHTYTYIYIYIRGSQVALIAITALSY